MARRHKVSAAASSPSGSASWSKNPLASKDSVGTISPNRTMRFAIAGPTAAAMRAQLAAERQLPIVRPIGEPKRAPGVKVASARDIEAAADCPAIYDRNGRDWDFIDRCHAFVNPMLIGESVVATGETHEAADVRSRDESLPTDAAESCDPDGGIARDRPRDSWPPWSHLSSYRCYCRCFKVLNHYCTEIFYRRSQRNHRPLIWN
jgi:hypothetical protein